MTTYEGPASITKIFQSGFSASRDATTLPPTPPVRFLETIDSNPKFSISFTSRDNEIISDSLRKILYALDQQGAQRSLDAVDCECDRAKLDCRYHIEVRNLHTFRTVWLFMRLSESPDTTMGYRRSVFWRVRSSQTPHLVLLYTQSPFNRLPQKK